MTERVDPITISHLDLTRYLGRWFEIARLPMRHEPANATDITATYSLDEQGAIRVQNRMRLDGEVEESIGQAKPVDESNSKLEVTFLPAGLRWIPFTKGDYWVLKLDDAYSVSLVGSPDRKYLWLLHRSPQMDIATRDEWLQYARMRGYDLDDVIFPSQSGRVHREGELASP